MRGLLTNDNYFQNEQGREIFKVAHIFQYLPFLRSSHNTILGGQTLANSYPGSMSRLKGITMLKSFQEYEIVSHIT